MEKDAAQSPKDYSDLKAVFFNGTLKRSPQTSNTDGLINISQGVHKYLKEHDVPHVWNVDSNAHDPAHWRNNLYHFAQKLFR